MDIAQHRRTAQLVLQHDVPLTIPGESVMICCRRNCAEIHRRQGRRAGMYQYNKRVRKTTNEYKDVFYTSDIWLAVEEYTNVQPAAYADAGA